MPTLGPLLLHPSGQATGGTKMIAQKHGSGCGVDGVNRVVARNYIHDVVNSLVAPRRNIHARNDKRAAVYFIVHRNRDQQAERTAG